MSNTYDLSKIIKQNVIRPDNNFEHIINFFMKTDKNNIQMKYLDIIRSDESCDKILGKGYNGTAFIPSVNNYIKKKLDDKKIKIPVVIKTEHHGTDIQFNIINNILYIWSQHNITLEAIILMLVKKLTKYSVNLPTIFSYGICEDKKYINKMVSLRHGLPIPIEIRIDNFFTRSNLWNGKPHINIFTSSLSNVYELITYILYFSNDGMIMLPNGIECDVIDLFDQICISYLVTYKLLTDNNIFPSDFHPGNIFIHWLNTSSYYNNRYIGNIKKITYKIIDKYYEINTFGMIFILGDIGNSIVKIKDDVILIGCLGAENQINHLDIMFNPNYMNTEFFDMLRSSIPTKIFDKLIINKIYFEYPYNEFVNTHKGIIEYPDKISHIKDRKNVEQLLEYFNKYSVPNYTDDNNNVLIEIKKY